MTAWIRGLSVGAAAIGRKGTPRREQRAPRTPMFD